MKYKLLQLIFLVLIYSACNEPANPPIHPDEWIISGAENSHTEKIAESGIVVCKDCHGGSEKNDYFGGTSGVSCYDCHAGGPSGHPGIYAWISPDSAEYHGRIFWENGWDFSNCQQCHGLDFAGGVVESSCNTCHTSGIGSCTTCHGDKDANLAYPPNDIHNNTDSTLVSIGAHRPHMETEIATVRCEECHLVPGDYLDEGHLGADNIAEITFGTVASDSGAISPTWDRSDASCNTVYCHGSFSFAKSESSASWAYLYDFITGIDTLVTWTGTAELNCSSCHQLPPQGHIGENTQTQCSSCHGSMIDENGNIIDKTKHINGQIDLN